MPVWAAGKAFVNSLTHAIAAVLFSITAFWLIRDAVDSGSADHVIGNTAFSLTLVWLYAVSAVYHGLREGRLKKKMRFIDHISVFAVIAASYTPFALTVMRPYWGYPIIAFIWGLFALGTIVKIWFFDLFEPYASLLYVAMGWVCVFSIRTMLRVFPLRGILWIAGGGIIYTIGSLIFIAPQPFVHAIFHVVMMGGSFCHVMAVRYYT
jgi:hemolysin III